MAEMKAKKISIQAYLSDKKKAKIDKPTEADCYVFSIFSYSKFEKISKLGITHISIGNYAKLYTNPTLGKLTHTSRAVTNYVTALGQNPRYAGLRLNNFCSVHDIKKEVQFAAVTILLPNKTLFISFRGTDETLVGWKEDINLVIMDEVPSQKMAVDYVTMVAKKYPEHRIYLGGHSKGGFLAIYAACFVSPDIQSRIDYIMDADSPGFHDSMLACPEYTNILDKIHTFIPEYDIVGLSFRKKQRITVVSSSGIGAWQHYHLSWNIVDDHLHHIEEIESGEMLSEGGLNKAMKTFTDSELKFFIEGLYALLKEDDILISLVDLLALKKLIRIIKKFSQLTPKERKDIRDIGRKVFHCIVTNGQR